MKFMHVILPSLALGGAATLLFPSLSEGFTTIGGALATGQRDVRLFNDFTNPGANDNTTPDSNFPGFDGAEMAIWKSVVEWGSVLHGSGNGDPHQPAGVGSGGANFDAAWAGNATAQGGLNDNVMDLVSGCGGGVLAYTETPIDNGWRIRFCSGWTWADGPGTAVTGIDIQGVSCHEYGHALGLGHTPVADATMFPSVSGSGVAIRSIAADDILGVQFIYGAASATKPTITGATANLSSVTITGQNFAASGNEVWFTRLNPTVPAGFPMVVVTGVTSNGTSISVTAPASAGPGDVLVKVPGTGHSTLSNAWPLPLGICPEPTIFCIAAPNSFSASGASIFSGGSTSVSANDFVLVTSGVPPGKLCLHLYGENQISPVTFGNGFRCLGSPFFRIYPAINADAFGDVVYPVDLNTLPPGGPINVGDTEGFMCWYRDPAAGGAAFNGSDAVSTTWCP